MARILSAAGIAKTSGEGDDIPDIRKTGGEQNHYVESDTESRMFDGSMPPKIQVPLELLLRHSRFFHPAIYDKPPAVYHVINHSYVGKGAQLCAVRKPNKL